MKGKEKSHQNYVKVTENALLWGAESLLSCFLKQRMSIEKPDSGKFDPWEALLSEKTGYLLISYSQCML